jgi:hypothetical protein
MRVILAGAKKGDQRMNPPDEFLRHAADCKRMARFAHDPGDKATWNRMAERWLRCAEWFSSQALTAHQNAAAKRYRKPAPGWAGHAGA